MCFIKNSKYRLFPVYQPCGNNCQVPTTVEEAYCYQLQQYPSSFIWNYSTVQNSLGLNQNTQWLQSILNQVQINNQAIESSLQRLQENQRLLLAIKNQIVQINEDFPFSIQEDERCQSSSVDELTAFVSSSCVINKIFGTRQYKYRIKSTCEFSKLIYKQRNLSIGVHLTSKKGAIIQNGNLIHLCIAVCDQNGKWIVGEDDDFFIKGKVESNLYRGECQFKKIYPKDISRHFPGGKVNIIIYPKPSILATTAPLLKGEHIVDCDLIEPLIFSNVVIKAKKKATY